MKLDATGPAEAPTRPRPPTQPIRPGRDRPRPPTRNSATDPADPAEASDPAESGLTHSRHGPRRGGVHRRDDQHGLRPDAGGNVPALDGAAILASTPGLDAIADVVPIDCGLMPASHFPFEDVLDLAVVCSGPWTTPRSPARWSSRAPTRSRRRASSWISSSRAKPVVVTGAMRAPHEEGFDGPANLRDAVAAAVSAALRDVGVVVTLAGTLEPADDVTKLHTTAFHDVRFTQWRNAGSCDGWPGRGGAAARAAPPARPACPSPAPGSTC